MATPICLPPLNIVPKFAKNNNSLQALEPNPRSSSPPQAGFNVDNFPCSFQAVLGAW